MKNKKVFLLMLCAGFSVAVFAQKQGTRVKPMLGVQYTSVKAPEIRAHTLKPGINVGLMADFNVSKKLSIETGFMYTDAKIEVDRGIRWRPDITASPWRVRETNTFRYMNFPVTAIYRFNKSSFYAGAGAGLSVNLTTSQSGFETSNQLTEKSYLNRFSMQSSLGMPLGIYGQAVVGKEVKIGKLSGGLRVQYTLDATTWKYPTSGNYERNEPYQLRNSGVSINAYINLSTPAAKTEKH